MGMGRLGISAGRNGGSGFYWEGERVEVLRGWGWVKMGDDGWCKSFMHRQLTILFSSLIPERLHISS